MDIEISINAADIARMPLTFTSLSADIKANAAIIIPSIVPSTAIAPAAFFIAPTGSLLATAAIKIIGNTSILMASVTSSIDPAIFIIVLPISLITLSSYLLNAPISKPNVKLNPSKTVTSVIKT